MNQDPFLNGLTVISGRPAESGSGLALRLREMDANVISQPGLTLSEADNSEQIRRELEGMSDGDLVIVVSPYAARCALNLQPASQWPSGLDVYAVGSQTANTLNEAGIRATAPEHGEGSEALLEMIMETCSDEQLAETACFILCAAGGRRILHDSLSKRCRTVTDVQVYQRRPAAVSESLNDWLDAYAGMPVTDQLDNIPVLIVTSVAILERLSSIISERFGSEDSSATETIWRHWPMVVSSPRIMASAFESGWKQVCLSNGSGDSDLIESLLHCLAAGSVDDSDDGAG